MQFAIWARMVSEAGTFYPPDVIQVPEGREFNSPLARSTSAGGSPTRAPRLYPEGQVTHGDEEQGRLLGGHRDGARAGLMQTPDAFGCKLGDYS